MYANGGKIYQFIPKDAEIKPYPLCLENISKNVAVDNIKRPGLNGLVYDFLLIIILLLPVILYAFMNI